MAPRAFEELCRIASTRNKTHQIRTTFEMTVFEVYNESIRDLLARPEDRALTYDIKTEEGGGVYVTNVRKAACASPAEFLATLRSGQSNRAQASTSMNAHSSRSHLIVTVHIKTAASSSKLVLVDLAGSERLAKSQVNMRFSAKCLNPKMSYFYPSS